MADLTDETFIRALKRKQTLEKGTPGLGADGKTIPDIYKAEKTGPGFIQRLRSKFSDTGAEKVSPSAQAILDRTEAEKAEGVTRNKSQFQRTNPNNAGL